MNVGTELRELRRYHAKSLKDLAAESGLSVSYLSDIERNHRCTFDTTLATLNRILACYGLEAKIVFQAAPS